MKHIHFIGICGVAMSALAIAFQKNNWRVTGSDAGFFPPISTRLKDHKIDFYPGWHPEKMGNPDLVVIGPVASSHNPERLMVEEKKIPYKSYPETIAEYFVKKNSIVCAGTYGKTTSAALLSWILKKNNYNPSYMFGGITLNNFDSARFVDSDWNVLEGDEYKSANWDNQPKFVHYSPTHLLLTSIIWDHADMYPTEEAYEEAFRNLVAMAPDRGLIVACDNVEKIVQLSNCQIIKYGAGQKNDYWYSNIQQTKNGLSFDINHDKQVYSVSSPMLGGYQAENITGCFAMAHAIKIPPEQIIVSIASCPGLKRRLEKRYEGAITVFDDIGHSPTKARSALSTLRKIYSGKIFAIFEPNTGNRHPQSIPGYNNAFAEANEVIIPTLTKLKKDQNNANEPFDGKKIAEIISKTHRQAQFIEDDEDLVTYLSQTTNSGDVIVFLGSHGFRGMIESLIKQIN